MSCCNSGRLSQELIAQLIDDLRAPLFYVCGPNPMMATVTELLTGLGVEPARIKTEAFVSAAARDSADATLDESPATVLKD
jgi:ferredoxin-NADP reductase